MYDLQLHWNCDKSVARIRLVKTENPSACATVNCEVCRIAIALYCLSSRVVWMYKVSIIPIIQSKTPSICHPYTWQYEYHVFLELRYINSHYGTTQVPNSAPKSWWISTIYLDYAVGPGLPRDSPHSYSALNCIPENRDKMSFRRNRNTKFTGRNHASNLQVKVNMYNKIGQVWTYCDRLGRFWETNR
jgi:hypothetical protein